MKALTYGFLLLWTGDQILWERIKYSDDKGRTSSDISNITAFVVNVYLCAYNNYKFTYSVIQVHIDGMDYSVDDGVICYFCIHHVGVTVPLRPGDIMLVNALEYQCLSSRCAEDMDIFCVSGCLKT